jgi:hypothetical protein
MNNSSPVLNPTLEELDPKGSNRANIANVPLKQGIRGL